MAATDNKYISNDREIILNIRNSNPKHLSVILRRRYRDIYQRVINFNKSNKLITESISQSIFNYIHQIKTAPLCPVTGKVLKWNGTKWRYREYAKKGVKSAEAIERGAKKRRGKKFVKQYINYKDLTVPSLSHTELCNKFKSTFKGITNCSMISQQLKFSYPELKKQIYDYYSPLYVAPFKEYIYLISRELKLPPKCCINDEDFCTFISYNDGYKEYNTKNVYIKKQRDRIAAIDAAEPYDKQKTIDELQKHINTISKQNIMQNLGSIDINLVKSVLVHGAESAETFSQKCHLLLYNKPVDVGRVKSQFMGFNTGYVERFKNTNTSAGEEEVNNFISQYFLTEKYRSDKEIDIFIPNKKIGIEYNGEYYHSNVFKPNDYHINKTLHFNRQGIQLFQIFENEWYQKKDIVKSILRSKIGVIDNKIFARQCTIAVIETNQKRDFLCQNHIQGNDRGFLNIGLLYNGELVSIMTFARRKITGAATFELSRFCSKLNTAVVGAASKLFNYFLKNYYDGISEITTYADLRYTQDSSLYETLGFKFSHRSVPNYYYFKPAGGGQYMKLLHRSSFMKHTLKYKLKFYDDTKTEKENMRDNGYNWIYDCGNNVYKYRPRTGADFEELIN